MNIIHIKFIKNRQFLDFILYLIILGTYWILLSVPIFSHVTYVNIHLFVNKILLRLKLFHHTILKRSF